MNTFYKWLIGIGIFVVILLGFLISESNFLNQMTNRINSQSESKIKYQPESNHNQDDGLKYLTLCVEGCKPYDVTSTSVNPKKTILSCQCNNNGGNRQYDLVNSIWIKP